MLGRAIGMMDTQHKALSWVCAALFATGVFIISRGTLYELQWRGNFADTVSLLWADGFICAITLLTLVKTRWIHTLFRAWADITPFFRYIRVPCIDYPCAAYPGIELKNWPILDIIWIFCATLAASLLLSMLVQRIDRNRLVS